MKTKLTYTQMILAGILLLTACSEDEKQTYSTDEAAETMAASLSESYSGLTATLSTSAEGATVAVENSGGRIEACGYSESESISKTSANGSDITYNFSFLYAYEMTCSADVPLSLAVDVTYAGEYEGARMASSLSGTGDFTFSALDVNLDEFEVTGTYTQTGTFESKVRNMATATNTIEVVFTDITINKTTEQITSGTASITITGTASGYEPYSVSASVTFNGNKSGTITVKGVTYSVNLLTGEVTKQ